MLLLCLLCLFLTLQKCGASAPSCASRSFTSFSDNDIINCTTFNFSLQSEKVELNRSLIFSGVQDFTLQGQMNENGQMTTIFCSNNAGIYFRHVCTLSITFVEFFNCGTSLIHHPISSNITIRWFYAVFIENCTDVTILQVNFTNSNGTGLVIRNTHHVNISYCVFRGNRIEDQNSNMAFGGGGGLHIVIPTLGQRHTVTSPSITLLHAHLLIIMPGLKSVLISPALMSLA